MIPIKFEEAAPIQDFWERLKKSKKSANATFDIKEWNSLDDDIVMDVLAEEDAVYIMQFSISTHTVLKKFTPDKTYFYSLGWFPFYFFTGQKTSFGALIKLSDSLLVYGPLLIDLRNLMSTMYLNPYKIMYKYFVDKGVSRFNVSNVKLSDTSWLYIENRPDGAKGWKQKISLHQITSPMNCLSCEDFYEILKLSGKDTSAFKCRKIEYVKAKLDFLWKDWVSNIDTSKLTNMSMTEGATKNATKFDFFSDDNRCASLMKKIMYMSHTKSMSKGAEDIYSDFYLYCNFCQVQIFLPLFKINKKSENLKRNNFIINSKDSLDSLFEQAEQIYLEFINVIRILKSCAGKDTENKTAEFVLKLINAQAKDMVKMCVNKSLAYSEYADNNTSPWTVISKMPDSFISQTIGLINGQEELPLDFNLETHEITAANRFSGTITYAGLGPMGCVKNIVFKDIDNKIDTIVKVDIIDENNIILWAFEDILGKLWPSYFEHNYTDSSFVYRLYHLNVEKQVAREIKVISIPKGFNPLDKGSMAVNGVIKKDFLIFKDYFISSFDKKNLSSLEVNSVEIKKPLRNISYIKDSAATFIQTNINVMSSWLYSNSYHSSFPTIPQEKRGPKDITTAVWGSDWLCTNT